VPGYDERTFGAGWTYLFIQNKNPFDLCSVVKNKVIGISYELKRDNGESGMQPWETVSEMLLLIF